MIYAFIIYTMLTIAFGRKKYLQNNEIKWYVKITHFTLVFIIFQYYFQEFRQLAWDIFKNGINELIVLNEFENFPKILDMISSLVYFITCFYVSGLTLHMAINTKGRKLFLISSPVLVFITSVDYYKLFLNDKTIQEGLALIFIIILLVFSIFFSVINIYFNLGSGRKVFASK